MIVVRMRGGLGNQLFQYAYAYALKRKDEKILLDIREYDKYDIRSFELDNYYFGEDIYISKKKICIYDSIIVGYHLYQYLYTRLKGHSPLGINQRLVKKGYILGGRSSPIPNVKLPNNIYLYGYFQNESVIGCVRGKLKEKFTIENSKEVKDFISLLGDKNVAISIRCGDDYKKKRIPICSQEYYKKCLKILMKRKGVEQIVIFSDCIEKVKSENWFEFFNGTILYVEKFTPCEQIEIMKKCNDYIISNSSFAWWGAYLGSYQKDCCILAPEYWNEHGAKTKELELFYDNMEIITLN